MFQYATSAQDLHQKLWIFEPAVQVLEMLYKVSHAK